MPIISTYPLDEIDPTDLILGHNAAGNVKRFSPSIAAATSNLTFWVATTGSDSNPGTQADPFLTIQRALAVASRYDYQGLYFPTINIGDGTYTGPITIPQFKSPKSTGSFSGGILQDCARIIGNATTPGNVIITDGGTGRPVITRLGTLPVFYKGFQVNGTGVGFLNFGVRQDYFGGINMNVTSVCILGSSTIGDYVIDPTFTIVSTSIFVFMQLVGGQQTATWDGGSIVAPSPVTITGSFFYMSNFSSLYWDNLTVTGTFTGKKLIAIQYATIWTQDGVAADLPGSITPTTDIDNSLWWKSSTAGKQGWAVPAINHDPSTADLPDKTWQVFKNTVSGDVYLSYNDGGVIKQIELL